MTYKELKPLLDAMCNARRSLEEFKTCLSVTLAYRSPNGAIYEFRSGLGEAAKVLVKASCDAQVKHLRDAYLAACKAADITPDPEA